MEINPPSFAPIGLGRSRNSAVTRPPENDESPVCLLIHKAPRRQLSWEVFLDYPTERTFLGSMLWHDGVHLFRERWKERPTPKFPPPLPPPPPTLGI